MTDKKIFFLTKFEWSLFLFLWIAYAFFYNDIPGYNVNTRMDLIYSMVDQGKINIDSYWNTGYYFTRDVAAYKGHYYCDKSPLLSYFGVPIYWAWRQLGDIFGFYPSPMMGRYPVVTFTINLFSAILSILLFRFFGYIKQNPRDQLIVTLIYSLGTMAFPYGILFFSHQAAAFFVFASFYLLFSYFNQHLDHSPSSELLVCSGILVGLGFAVEQPAGIVLAGITIYLFFVLKNKTRILWYLLGILLPFLIVMHYNYICFENPLASGYKYEYIDYFRGSMSQGFMGITLPKWEAFWGITFSEYRGLFFLSPVLLFAIPGFYYLLKDKKFKWVSILSLFIVVSFITFNSSYYAWWGGWACGPRHLIPMLPYLMIPLYFIFHKYRKWIIPFGILSIVSVTLVAITDPQAPQGYKFPILDYNLPMLVHEELTHNILSIWGLSRVTAVFLWGIYIIIGISILYKMSISSDNSPSATLHQE